MELEFFAVAQATLYVVTSVKDDVFQCALASCRLISVQSRDLDGLREVTVQGTVAGIKRFAEDMKQWIVQPAITA